MSIAAIIASINKDIFDTIGETVTYLPVIGDAVEVKALIITSLQSQPSGMGSETWGQVTTIEFMVDDLPDNAPILGDTIIHGDTEYVIASVTDNDGRVVKCIVS